MNHCSEVNQPGKTWFVSAFHLDAFRKSIAQILELVFCDTFLSFSETTFSLVTISF